jgi:gliding motility-associated-like protein
MKRPLLYLILSVFILCGKILHAQSDRQLLPSNDDQCNPDDFGLLGIPPLCSVVNPAPDTVFVGSTSGASASQGGNPYPFSCSSLANASDLWYKFTASSERLTIHMYSTGNSPIPDPVFALYRPQNGNCQNLIPLGCGSGTGLAVHTFESLLPGSEYYLQVASATANFTGDFGLKLYPRRTCDECVQRTKLSLYPPPVNGGYPPNTTVHMVAEISGFSWIGNTARLHGIFPTFGAGWDPATLAPVNTEYPQSVDGAGLWKWDSINSNFGFYYDTGNDGIPDNNLGDLNTQASTSWTGGWIIKTDANCVGTVPLTVNLFTSTDAETGSGTDITHCMGDTAVTYDLWSNCCGQVQIVAVTPETCGFSSLDGSVTFSVGSIGTYDFEIINSTGNMVFNGTGVFTSTFYQPGLHAGDYTLQIYSQTLGCWTYLAFTIPGNIELNVMQNEYGCANTPSSGGAVVNVTGTTTGPFDYYWYLADGSFFGQTQGTSATADTVTSLYDGVCYYVVVNDVLGCAATSDLVCITLQPADISTMNFLSPLCISPGDIVLPNQQLTDDAFFFNSTPNNSVATIDVNTGQFTPDEEGMYLIFYQSSLSSACPAIFEDTVVVAFIPPTPVAQGQATFEVCEGTTQMPQFQVVNNPLFQTLWVNSIFSLVGSGDTYTPPQTLPPGTNNFYAVYYNSLNTSCFSSTTFSAEVFSVPTVELGSDITICPGDTATLTAISNSTTNTFYWQPYDPSYLQTQTGNGTNLVFPSADLTLYVYASLPNPPWCQATDSIHIHVDEACNDDLLPYTGFTPNADGKNDTWVIDGIDQLPNTSVTIYSRWGDKVWTTEKYNNADNAWRGTDSSGNNLPEGTYYFVIISNGQTTQGWVELVR